MADAHRQSPLSGIRKRAVVLAAAALALLCSACGSRTAAPPPAPPKPFTVMTYNINFAAPSPRKTLAAIRRGDADFVCLEEVTPAWFRLIRDELGADYPHILFRDHPKAGGRAILSRFKVEELWFTRPDVGWHPAWLASVQAPGGDVKILSVHLNPPLADDGRFNLFALVRTPSIRRREIEQLYRRLADGSPSGDPSREPVVIMGDFNEGVAAPAVAWLVEKGFSNALPRFDPQAKTWRWGVGRMALTGVYDHVLCSQRLEILGAKVLPDGGSDHYPVVAKLRLRP